MTSFLPFNLWLAWRNLWSRPLHTLIPALVIGLSVALSIAVAALGDGVRQGIIAASDPFGVLVIGAKGSSQQLVLNTLLLQGLPVGNFPFSVYESLQANTDKVALAVPLAFGDNLGGARIIGTDATLLELRTAQNQPPYFQIASGRYFQAHFEAVLGASAARALGLSIGDRFQAAHGVELGLEEDLHDEAYTVVGIFAPSQSVYDTAVFVSYQSIWAAHEAEEDERGAQSLIIAAEDADPQQLTAVLVRPTGFAQANQLWQEFYSGTEAQAAFPGQELGGLFDLLGQAERVLTAVGWLVLGIAALTVFLSMYSAMAAREQAIAIMRGLGSSQPTIFIMILAETLMLTLLGALLGRVLGYATAGALAGLISDQSAIAIPIRFLPALEPLLWILPLGVGLAAGLIPAAMAYRVSVSEKLFT
ncbi:MAG: ABC transporter permease [Pleurocapsa minor GSE-CHR-MK-17-07R]|jgi:putative ABC transport system permease protein|nr:ABC transporter permease [Pleurocapsa minor GSE-CHR-MK 17-07R]